MTVIYVKAYTKSDGTFVKGHVREIGDKVERNESFYKDLNQSSENLSCDIWDSFENFTKVKDEDISLYEQALQGNKSTFKGIYQAVKEALPEVSDEILIRIEKSMKESEKNLNILKSVIETYKSNNANNPIITREGVSEIVDKFFNKSSTQENAKEMPKSLNGISLEDETIPEIRSKYFRNISTYEMVKDYKKKTGKEPPKSLNEANVTLEEMCENVSERIVNKANKDSKPITRYEAMTDEEKYIANHIYSSFELRKMSLFNMDKTEMSDYLKDKKNAYYGLDDDGKKKLIKETGNFLMDSSGIFKEGIKKPEINFSKDIDSLGHYDTGKDEIVINPKYFYDSTYGDSEGIINTLAEEVAHAVINKHPNKENDERIRYLKNASCIYAGYNQNSDLYGKNPNEKIAKYNAERTQKNINIDGWKSEKGIFDYIHSFANLCVNLYHVLTK